MNFIRYINGKRVEEKDLKNYTLENDIILETIALVNERINRNFTKKH